MEKVFAILSQEFGFQTVIKAVIVCVVMMGVKKIKPNLSPKVEVIIRLALSVLIHLLFTVITKGEFLGVTKDVMCVCGVSMIFSQVMAKSYNKKELEQSLKPFLPDFDLDKINECTEQTEKDESIVATELIENEKERFSIRN